MGPGYGRQASRGLLAGAGDLMMSGIANNYNANNVDIVSDCKYLLMRDFG